MNGGEDHMLLTQLISCHLKTVTLLTHLLPLPHLHLYCFAKLSHLAGEVNDSGQGLKQERECGYFRKNKLGRPLIGFLL